MLTGLPVYASIIPKTNNRKPTTQPLCQRLLPLDTNGSYTFLAVGVEKLSEQHQEETEDINVDIFIPEEVKQLLEVGEIIQALHAAPLWKYFALHGWA